jgi:hypothetical protein
MSYRHAVSTVMISTKIEDKIMNEMTYQMTKRGYEIVFTYTPDGKLVPKSYTCSKGIARYIKFITFVHVVLKPAWFYHDDVDEIIEED